MGKGQALQPNRPPGRLKILMNFFGPGKYFWRNRRKVARQKEESMSNYEVHTRLKFLAWIAFLGGLISLALYLKNLAAPLGI